jgi:hypothetical protein
MVVLFVVASIGGAAAQSDSLDELAKRPGAEILKRSPDGSRVLALQINGVKFWIDSTPGSEPSVLSWDDSGHGAILCVWEIVVGTKVAADVCSPEEFSDLSKVLGEDIEALNDFIVANSLTPTTKADLKADYDQRMQRMKASIRPGGDNCHYMRSNFIEPMAQQLRSTSRDVVDRSLKASLAALRPPVMNPCL